MTENVDVPLPEGHGVSVRFAPSRAFDPAAFPSGGAGMVGTADDVLRVLEAAYEGMSGALTLAMRDAVYGV